MVGTAMRIVMASLTPLSFTLRTSRGDVDFRRIGAENAS